MALIKKKELFAEIVFIQAKRCNKKNQWEQDSRGINVTVDKLRLKYV